MQKLSRDLQIFIVAVILAASAMLVLLSPQVKWEAWPELLLFGMLIILARIFAIPDPRGGVITATPILFYILFSVHGPGAGIMIGGFAFALGSAISRGWVPWRTLFNGAQIGISIGLGGLVFESIGGSLVKPEILSFLLPFTLAALTHQLSNNFFAAVFYSRLRRLPLLSTWLADMRELLWSNILSVPSAALLAILYVSVHPAILLFYLASLPLQRWALQLYLQQRSIYSQAIDSLVVAIDSDFPEGRGHSRRVAETAVAIARNLRLSDWELENIEMGALLHDVGMIGLVDVLELTTSTDPAQAGRFREHVRLGAEIARQLPGRGRNVAEIVLYHHENFDGSGYPLGLKGAQIPFGARIVGLAEAYESMLATGLARERPSHSQAVEIIRAQAGKMYDPRVVEAFLSCLGEGSIPTIVHSAEIPTTETISRSGAISS